MAAIEARGSAWRWVLNHGAEWLCSIDDNRRVFACVGVAGKGRHRWAVLNKWWRMRGVLYGCLRKRSGTERFGSINGIGGWVLVCSVVRKDRAERFYSIDRCGREADCAWMLKIMEGTMGFRVIADS